MDSFLDGLLDRLGAPCIPTNFPPRLNSLHATDFQRDGVVGVVVKGEPIANDELMGVFVSSGFTSTYATRCQHDAKAEGKDGDSLSLISFVSFFALFNAEHVVGFIGIVAGLYTADIFSSSCATTPTAATASSTNNLVNVDLCIVVVSV